MRLKNFSAFLMWRLRRLSPNVQPQSLDAVRMELLRVFFFFFIYQFQLNDRFSLNFLSFTYYTFIGSFVAFFHLVFYLRVYILTRKKISVKIYLPHPQASIFQFMILPTTSYDSCDTKTNISLLSIYFSFFSQLTVQGMKVAVCRPNSAAAKTTWSLQHQDLTRYNLKKII